MELLFFDTVLRSAAAGIFALIAILLVSKRPTDRLMWLGAFAFACASGHVFHNSAAWRTISTSGLDVFWLFSVSAVPLIWAFAMGVFSDRRDLFWQRLIPFFVMSCVNMLALVVTTMPHGRQFMGLWLPHLFVNVTLMLHLLWILARDIGGDLVETRRSMRAPTLVFTGLYVVGMAFADLFNGFSNQVPHWPIAQSGAQLVLAIGAAFAFLQVGDVFWGRETSAPETAPAATQAAIVDNLLLARLKTALSDGQIWKREGLTIGALAAELSVPEYRLRRVINENLGHRNFADFINSNRVDAAMVALSQPVLSPPSMTQLSFDLGFASIGPFNRAFKRVTGVAPTVWRTQKLTETSKS
jgi:AraC-like DNA-binding protein